MITREQLIGAINNRHSTRSFVPKHLSDEQLADLNAHIAGLPPLPLDTGLPDNEHYELKIINIGENDGDNVVKRLGCYGVIKGARQFLLLSARSDTGRISRLTRNAAAFTAEHAVLYLCHNGIGSCWMSGTIHRDTLAPLSSFGREAEILAAIPFGMPSDKTSLIDKLMRTAANSRSRKPFEKLFDCPPSTSDCIKYALELMRLAPSGCNLQPWRAKVISNEEIIFHIQGKPTDMNALDMGIALCHFNIGAPRGIFRRCDKADSDGGFDSETALIWKCVK